MVKYRYAYWKYLLLGGLMAFIAVSCATQKKKSDQSGLSRFYHNTTSKFNGYFNANELVLESIEQLEGQYTDNYIDLLELYKYRGAANPEAVSSNLDEAIKKVSIVATLHDNSDWVDDCYLLIGKCYYLKQDFETAQSALEFFMDEFEPDGTRSENARASKNAKKRKSTTAKEQKKREMTSRQRAKQAEKERKAYNKALKKQQKKNKKKGRSKSPSTPDKPSEDDIIVSKRNLPSTSSPPPKEDENDKAREEEAQSQNPGGIKHRPAYQEAQLWLAKTYVERELYPRAEYHLNALAANPYLQDEVRVELPVAQAYYSIRRENYAGAIPYLEQAIEVADKKRDKARYAFIIAQIMEMENRTSGKAYDYYSKVLDYGPDYDLEFNAKMSMARTAFFSGASSVAESKALLEKMLKDEKNLEYLDRIYFTYARLYLLENDHGAALTYLNQAANHTGNNAPLETEIYHLMATLYFEKGDYVEAKEAYDKALATMRKDDERYAMTELMSKNLTDIAKHVQIIELQDSLLRISQMSDDEKRALAKELNDRKAAGYASSGQGQGDFSGVKPAKGAASKQLAADPNTAGGPPVRQVVTVNPAQSKFFAYDDKAIRRGEREFFTQWGGRPLTDNWRVSSKIDEAGGVTIQDAGPAVASKELTDDEMSNILKDVPSTPEEIAEAEAIIQSSMLELGYLYREKMEDAQQSVDELLSLLNKYPDTDKRIEAYYELYLSYLVLNDVAKSNLYKQKIIDEFPGSKFALALSDPDYMSKQLNEERKLQIHYDSIYALVQSEQYQEAADMINAGKASYGTNHEYYPRIAILEAMCTGNLEGREAYIAALQQIVAGYPNTPEETKARDMLLLLGEYKGNKLNISTGGTASSETFRVQPNTVHYMLVMITNYQEIDSKDAKISISDYNRKYHQLDRLKISSLVFDPKTGQSVILVRSFSDAADAMKYYQNALKHTDEFLPPNAQFDLLPVSQYNYREIIKQRSIDSYRAFFEENYN